MAGIERRPQSGRQADRPSLAADRGNENDGADEQHVSAANVLGQANGGAADIDDAGLDDERIVEIPAPTGTNEDIMRTISQPSST